MQLRCCFMKSHFHFHHGGSFIFHHCINFLPHWSCPRGRFQSRSGTRPLPPPFANIHLSDNRCCGLWLSLLLIDLFLGQKVELLCSLLSFVLQPPSSSLQLLLKLLRLTKVNGCGRPLLLLLMAIDGGLHWVFIHLAGAWLECVWLFGLTKCGNVLT